MTKTIKKIKELYQDGFEMYCWSSGGADYAKKTCQEFGIEDCFKFFLPKPNFLVDDQDINEWNFLIKEFPQNFSNLSKEEIIKKMNVKKGIEI